MAMLVYRSVTLHFLSSNSGIRDRESFKWIFSENVQSVTYIAPEKWCLGSGRLGDYLPFLWCFRPIFRGKLLVDKEGI